jgi:hypothetical protein
MQNTNDKKEKEDVTTVKREDYQYTPKEGFVPTHFLTVADVKRSTDFYLRILGGKVIRSGEPTIIQIANSWNAVTSLRCMKMRGLDIWVLCSKSIRMIDSIGSLTTSTLILTPLGQRINTSLSPPFWFCSFFI